MTITEMVKASNNIDTPKTELGTLPRKDSVLMQFIIENLTNATYWALIVNDLDLDNFNSEKIEGQNNRYKMQFNLKWYEESNRPQSPEEQNGDYNKKSTLFKR